MKITTIIKRLGYFVWAMGGLTYNTLDAFVRAAYRTLYLGEKVHWVYSANITPEEAQVAIVNNHVTGEQSVVPIEDTSSRKAKNNYHLRYNYSARGV